MSARASIWSNSVVGGLGTGVQVAGITRALDTYVQSQLRTETSGGGYADQMSSVLPQLQNVYGTPGGQGTLETAFSNLTSAVQGLSANSGAYSAQSAVVTAAQNMAQQLNSTTQGIQALRTNVQQDIATSVSSANAAMAQIANLNTQLQGLSPTDPGAATLEDQRDTAINQLSQLMDVRVSTSGNNQVSIYTNSGIQLVGAQASKLSFNGPATLNASNLYSTNPTQNGVGTITLTSPSGATVDMDCDKRLQFRPDRGRSPVARHHAGAGTEPGRSTGRLDVERAIGHHDRRHRGDVRHAGRLHARSDQYAAGQHHQSDLYQHRDQYPAAAADRRRRHFFRAAIADPSSTSPNTAVIGVNVSGGMASIVSQLNAALGGANLQFSNPSGSTLQVLNRHRYRLRRHFGLGDHHDLVADQRQPGAAALYRWHSLYTGAINGSGSQMTGYAGRITVNPAVVANPSSLTVYSTSPPTASGDTTRADFINSQLTTGSFTFSPVTGLGSSSTPFTGTITSYMQQFLSLQGNNATNAQQLAAGSGRRREHPAAELQFRHGRQHGRANVQSDCVAECLFGQRPCDGRGAIDVLNSAAGAEVRRSHGDQ